MPLKKVGQNRDVGGKMLMSKFPVNEKENGLNLV
jgi:hypothetical protein